MPKPTNPYAQTYANFLKNTEDHVLNVIHDDGLYRHLRFQEPGTRMWSMDLVTWPGHLATSGDIGEGLIFSREPDMIDFFADAGKIDGYYSDGAPSIDFRYWAEKIQGRGLVDVRKYDSDLFLQLVREHLEESEALGTEAQAEHEKAIEVAKRVCRREGIPYEAYVLHQTMNRAVREHRLSSYSTGLDLLRHIAAEFNFTLTPEIRTVLADPQTIASIEVEVDNAEELEYFDLPILPVSPAERRDEIFVDARWHSESEHDAHIWLRDNEDHVGADTWEWDLRGFDAHFLFACYSIDAAVRLYRGPRAEEAS